jgi:predicted MPP superfamily phosphohydrolase
LVYLFIIYLFIYQTIREQTHNKKREQTHNKKHNKIVITITGKHSKALLTGKHSKASKAKNKSQS